jgi:hypothetical protein
MIAEKLFIVHILMTIMTDSNYDELLTIANKECLYFYNL